MGFSDLPAATPQQPGCSLPAVAAPVTGTPTEELTAKQKAHFVGETWQVAKAKKLPLEQAAQIVATRTEKFPDLISAGKKGKSLLAETKAWTNYRSWSSKIGKTDGTKRPDVDNWRALLPRYKGSRGYQRQGPPQFWTILANTYENENQLSLKYAHKLANLAWEALRKEPDQELPPAPSFGAVRYYYEQHADIRAVTIARQGEEWFRNNVAGYISREAPEVDVAWSGDHHIFDAAVRVQDKETGAWHPVRPWLTAWIDWGSLYFVGYKIRTISPNRDAIERALREGIASNDHRPPERLYVDNGKDYKALGFTRPILTDKDTARLESVCEALGCKVHFAIPFNARAKIAERTFRVVCEQFSKLWLSYRGSSPQKRPKHADAAWRDPESLPTLDEFTMAFEKWLATIYHQSESQGKALKGMTPMQARLEAQPLRPSLTPVSLYKAFLRELPGKPRKIYRGGVVQALNRHYRSEALWALMSRGERVRIKVDPDDISTVWIYTLDGREIGPATSKPMLPPFVDDNPESIEQLREEQRRHARQIRDAKRTSAASRDMSRWLRAAPSPGVSAGFITPGQKRLAKTVAPPALATPIEVDSDPALENDLDDALREQSATILAAHEESSHLYAGAAVESLADDMELLDEIDCSRKEPEPWDTLQ